jgi:hypothetical protein
MPESVEEKLMRNLMISLGSGLLLTASLFLVRCLLRGSFHTVITIRYFITFAFSAGGCYFLLTVVEDYRGRKRNRKIVQRAKQHAKQTSAIDWSANLQSSRPANPPTNPDQPK